jgi:hypothetical protein
VVDGVFTVCAPFALKLRDPKRHSAWGYVLTAHTSH